MDHSVDPDKFWLENLQESYEQKSAGFEIKRGDGRAMLEEMAAKIEGIFKKNEEALKVSATNQWL